MLLNLWTLVLILVGAGERVHLQNLSNESGNIAAGASEEDVLRALGQPTVRWQAREGLAGLIFGERPAKWIYGTRIDLGLIVRPGLSCPNPCPAKIRLLLVDKEDLVVDWTKTRHVRKIERPDLAVSQELTELYQPMYLISALLRLMPDSPQ